MLVTVVALSAFIAPANASFVHPKGIIITIYPETIELNDLGRPGEYPENLAVVIKPPWYFVDGLMGFDSVTLTVTLNGNCYQCVTWGDNPPTLAGGNNGQLVMQLGAVTMQEQDNGAFILCPITFVIDSTTSSGFYMLTLSAQATASDGTIFQGWNQVPVAVGM
jgi:hypothetical protein